MRHEIKLSDEQIERAFSEIGAGIDISEVVFTRDTLDDFERGLTDSRNPKAGLTLNKFREDNHLQVDFTDDSGLYVIDFGEVRGAYVG